MYRYSVDNAVTYSYEDFVLFREAPFACWMERLTLENPDHGIPADVDSHTPGNTTERQDDIAETLRAEGKAVSLIDWDEDESQRRAATLEAMRQGVDFIINGQLALGPLSGTVNLLMRTSGYSDLGNYLYIPCEVQAKTTLHPAFKLCFLADLLHSLQGQLPPQLLVIRSGDDLVPLQTEDHIYHYRAVKQRFMAAMSSFRKHRMPDPAESTHFGRWSECAHEVLKQRILREEQQEPGLLPVDHGREGASNDTPSEATDQPLRQAVGAAATPADASYDLDDVTDWPEYLPSAQAVSGQVQGGHSGVTRLYSGARASGPTLAEQASMLAPGTYKPGPGQFRFRPAAPLSAVSEPVSPAPAEPTSPELSRPDRARPDRARPDRARPDRARPDQALQNLEFIGSRRQTSPVADKDSAEPEPELGHDASSAPSPSLRDPRARIVSPPEVSLSAAPDPVLEQLTGIAGLMTAESGVQDPDADPQPVGERSIDTSARSAVDLDGDHPAWREPVRRERPPAAQVLPTAKTDLRADDRAGGGAAANSFPRGNFYPGEPSSDAIDSDDSLVSRPLSKGGARERDVERKRIDSFSNSLMTSENYEV